jgi:hypothetical protein
MCREGGEAIIVACHRGLLAAKFFDLLAGVETTT